MDKEDEDEEEEQELKTVSFEVNQVVFILRYQMHVESCWRTHRRNFSAGENRGDTEEMYRIGTSAISRIRFS